MTTENTETGLMNTSFPAQEVSIYNTPQSFEHAQRVAKMLSSSDIVPKAYCGNVANTLVALEIAMRIGESPLLVMQNLDIIQGKPGFNSKFIISRINTCGKYESVQFRYYGEGDEKGCVAYTKELKTGKTLEGPPVTIGMAKKEGWYTKPGSKWPNMPDLMLSYRAATFWGRLHAPELTLGMQTSDEIIDTVAYEVSDRPAKKVKMDELFSAPPEEITIVEEETKYPEPPKAPPVLEVRDIKPIPTIEELSLQLAPAFEAYKPNNTEIVKAVFGKYEVASPSTIKAAVTQMNLPYKTPSEFFEKGTIVEISNVILKAIELKA